MKTRLALTITALSLCTLAGLPLASVSASHAMMRTSVAPIDDTSPVGVRAAAQFGKVAQGTPVTIAVEFAHQPHYHTWPAKSVTLPKDVDELAIRTEVGMPIDEAATDAAKAAAKAAGKTDEQIDAIRVEKRPDWCAVLNVKYPEAKIGTVSDPSGAKPTIQVPLYSGRAVAFVTLAVKGDAPLGEHEVALRVSYQACNEVSCTPPEESIVSVKFNVVAAGTTDLGSPVEPALFIDLAAKEPGAAEAAPAGRKVMPAVSMGGAAARPAAKATERAPIDAADGKAEATLTMDLRMYDFEGTKRHNRMYMPSMAQLKPDRPAGVTKEPAYQGKPMYATVTLGNGTPNQFVIVSDEAEGKEPRLYLDLNGDGDLTNDATGAWETKAESKNGGSTQYSGTYTFKPGYKNPDGSNKVGEYALNFYWQAGRGGLGYYAASARVGKITVGGKTYDVTLIESDADGLFNKLYDSSKPLVVGEKMTKPVTLLLDGDQFDIRGSFGFGDLNYVATVSDDGSHLALTPTMKVVRIPRPSETQVQMLGAGVEAPDFEALAWNPGQTKLDTSNRFKLSDYRGKKIVVLDMWATWCGPCMAGIPHLSKVAEAVKGQDVVVIALNTSDDAVPFEKFASGKGKDYAFMFARDPAGRDPNGNTISRKLYNVMGIPATFVIGKDGKIVGTVSGYSEGDTRLEQILKGLGVKVD